MKKFENYKFYIYVGVLVVNISLLVAFAYIIQTNTLQFPLVSAERDGKVGDVYASPRFVAGLKYYHIILVDQVQNGKPVSLLDFDPHETEGLPQNVLGQIIFYAKLVFLGFDTTGRHTSDEHEISEMLLEAKLL